MDKLSIQNEMAQFDRKNREFYDSSRQRKTKKFSNYLMIRYGAVSKAAETCRSFILSAPTNDSTNISLHQSSSQTAMAVCHRSESRHGQSVPSVDCPQEERSWIRRQSQAVVELFPNYKSDDIEVLDAVNTQKEITAYLRELGQEVKK
jgi:hypothetical protein